MKRLKQLFWGMGVVVMSFLVASPSVWAAHGRHFYIPKDERGRPHLMITVINPTTDTIKIEYRPSVLAEGHTPERIGVFWDEGRDAQGRLTIPILEVDKAGYNFTANVFDPERDVYSEVRTIGKATEYTLKAKRHKLKNNKYHELIFFVRFSDGWTYWNGLVRYDECMEYLEEGMECRAIGPKQGEVDHVTYLPVRIEEKREKWLEEEEGAEPTMNETEEESEWQKQKKQREEQAKREREEKIKLLAEVKNNKQEMERLKRELGEVRGSYGAKLMGLVGREINSVRSLAKKENGAREDEGQEKGNVGDEGVSRNGEMEEGTREEGAKREESGPRIEVPKLGEVKEGKGLWVWILIGLIVMGGAGMVLWRRSKRK